MGKKKRQNAPTPSTTVHVIADIDYDKLAETIIKAQQMPKQETPTVSISNIALIKKTWAILRGKKETDGHFVVGLFALLAALFLKAVSFLAAVTLLLLIVFLFFSVINMTWGWQFVWGNLASILMTIVIVLLTLLIAIITYIASIEIEKTEDRNLVFAVFSSLTSFVALIVALIALKN